MAVYPQSGYFYDSASAGYPNGLFVGGRFAPFQRVVPLTEGYVQGVNMRIRGFEVNSGDLARDATFNVSILNLNSGANGFLSAELGSWTVVSTGSVVAESVFAAMSAQNEAYAWHNIPLNSAYMGIESTPHGPGSYATGIYDWGVHFTCASISNNSAFFAIEQNNDTAHPWFAFMVVSNSGHNVGDDGDYTNVQFNLYGQIRPNSRFLDLPQGERERFWTASLDSIEDRSFLPGGNNSRAVKFTAMSNKITRALIGTRFIGTFDTALSARIYTTNSTADYPETVVGCSYFYITVNSANTGGNDIRLFFGSLPNTALPCFFIFSGGVTVTSGGEYWLAVDATSYNQSSIREVAWFTYDNNNGTAKRAFSAGSEWAFTSGNIVNSQDHLFEIWYQVASIEAPSTPPPSSTFFEFNREFPVPDIREFPGYILREFPKP